MAMGSCRQQSCALASLAQHKIQPCNSSYSLPVRARAHRMAGAYKTVGTLLLENVRT